MIHYDERLESLIMVSAEKCVLDKINTQDYIDKFKEKKYKQHFSVSKNVFFRFKILYADFSPPDCTLFQNFSRKFTFLFFNNFLKYSTVTSPLILLYVLFFSTEMRIFSDI